MPLWKQLAAAEKEELGADVPCARIPVATPTNCKLLLQHLKPLLTLNPTQKPSLATCKTLRRLGPQPRECQIQTSLSTDFSYLLEMCHNGVDSTYAFSGVFFSPFNAEGPD